MASAVLQTAEDQITCSICFEIFEEPKALPCLHTFCRKCINNYILEKCARQTDRLGFTCPMCRRYVTVNQNIHIEQWADGLENNHVISTMIDAYKSPSNRQKNLCKIHQDKGIEFYCFDHSEYLCSLCSLQHRRCRELTTSDEAQKRLSIESNKKTPKNKEHEEEERLIEMLFEQCNVIEHAIDKKKNAIEILEDSEAEIRSKIMNTRKRINELLAKHEEKVLSHLTEKKAKAVDTLQCDIDRYEKYGDKARDVLELLQNVKHSGKKGNKKTIDKAMKEYEEIQSKLSDLRKRISPEMFEFSMHPAVVIFLNSFDSFGKFTPVPQQKKKDPEDNQAITEVSNSGSKLKFVQQIIIPVPGGKSANITGLTTLSSGQMLLVDHLNEVLLLYDSNFTYFSQTKVHPPPYDIVSTSIAKNEAMVSCPDSGNLKQVFVYHDFVQIGQELNTGMQCKCLDFDGNFLSVCSNNVLHIYEADRETWMQIQSKKFERTTKITYVAIRSILKQVFVTDQKYPHPHILSLSFSGQILWRLEDDRIGFATGIAFFDSYLYVASWDKGKVAKISTDGQFQETVIVDGIEFPWKLCIKTDPRMLVLSQYKNSLSDDQKRVVKVFHIVS